MALLCKLKREITMNKLYAPTTEVLESIIENGMTLIVGTFCLYGIP